MKIAFLSEMNFEGKIPSNHPNMRTEFAWMYALDAIHHSIYNFNNIKGYDHIFIIFPKGILNLNAVGAKIANQPNPNSSLLELDIYTKGSFFKSSSNIEATAEEHTTGIPALKA